MSRNLALFAPLACMVMYLVWSPLVFAVVPPADAGYVLYNERIGGEVRGARAFPGGGQLLQLISVEAPGSSSAWWRPESIAHDASYSGGYLRLDPANGSIVSDSTWSLDTHGTAQADGGLSPRVATLVSGVLRNAGGGGNSSFDAAADASISFDTVYTGLGVAPTSSVPIEVSYRLSSLTFFGGSLMMAHSESAVSLRDSLGTVLDSASISTLVDASVYDQINNLNGILAFDVTLGTQYSSMISANSGLYAGGGLTNKVRL